MPATPDREALKAYLLHLFSKLEGAVTAANVYLGDRLGLYRGLAAAEGPLTSHALAEATGLAERWVREWLANQAAAGLIVFEGEEGSERFSLTPEAAAACAVDEHPAFGMGLFEQLSAMMAVLTELPEAFRSGIGLSYDAFGPTGARGGERAFAPWYRSFLVPVALPMLEGVVGRLSAGGKVADIGCGAGAALLIMAAAFPVAEFHGYDISEHALARAAENKEAAGVANAWFHHARRQPVPTDGSFDLITTFDCLHDMTDPAGMVATIRDALRPDGVWLLAETKGRGSLAANIDKNPMAAMMYGISVLACLSSGLSEPGGAGLGTLGIPEAKAKEMAEAARFTRFTRLRIDHPVNAFYEIRP